MNITQVPSIQNGSITRRISISDARISSTDTNKENNAYYPHQAPVSRVITKESLQEGSQEANPFLLRNHTQQLFTYDKRNEDDDHSLHSSLFDFSLFESENKERELLPLPLSLTSIELPLTPPPPLESIFVSKSFDNSAASPLTPAISVSSDSTSSLLSTAAAIAASQQQEASFIRAPPIVSVAPPLLPTVVSPKPKKRKPRANSKSSAQKTSVQKNNKQRPKQPQLKQRGTKAAPPSPPAAPTAKPQSLLTQRLMSSMDQQPRQLPVVILAPATTPVTAPSIAPRPRPAPAAAAIHHRQPQAAPITPGVQSLPSKKYAASSTAGGVVQAGYGHHAHPAASAAQHHAAVARSARAPTAGASQPSSVTSTAQVPANTISTLHPTTGQVENTGRWTSDEHRLFLQGLEQHGKGWKKIATLIKSRTVVQIRTHAQKYFQKLAKARQNGESVGGVGMGTVVGGVMPGNSVPGHGVHLNSAEGGDLGISIPIGPDGQPVVTMRTTTHPNSTVTHHGNMSLANDHAAMAMSSAARGGGRKRRTSNAGGGTKRRAIGNVVRSAVREGRNIKRQNTAEVKRKAVTTTATMASATATMASATATMTAAIIAPAAAPAAAPVAANVAPAPVVNRATVPAPVQATPPVAQPMVQKPKPGSAKGQAKEEYQVPNPLPSVSNVLDPYVTTTTLGMRPIPAPSAAQKAGQAKTNVRGRQQMVHTATHGTLPMAALEDAVFRLLTPATGAPSPPLVQHAANSNQASTNNNVIVDPLAPTPVNKIAIAHTQYHPPSAPVSATGLTYPQGIPSGMSPTGVADMSLLPSWVDAKNPPSWYNDGSDIDTLLEDADCLNWLSDTGDLDESYPPAMAEPAAVVSSSNSSGASSARAAAPIPPPALLLTTVEPAPVAVQDPTGGVVHPSTDSLSFLVDSPEQHGVLLMEPSMAAAVADVAIMAVAADHVEDVSQLPSFLDEDAHTSHPPPTLNDQLHDHQSLVAPVTAVETLPYSSATEAVEQKLAGVGESDTNLMSFPDLDMGDEQAFVSALLENSGQSTMSFPKLHSDVHMSQANMGGGPGNQSGPALNQHCGVDSGVLTGEDHIMDES